ADFASCAGLRARADRVAARILKSAAASRFWRPSQGDFLPVQERRGGSVPTSGRSRGCADLRRLPQEPRALCRALRPFAASARCGPASRLSFVEACAVALRLIEVQHHHAHVAACLAENLYPLRGAPVLGLVLDGLGWGAEGEIWGGELLLANYNDYVRLGALKPTAMPGGTAAI